MENQNKNSTDPGYSVDDSFNTVSLAVPVVAESPGPNALMTGSGGYGEEVHVQLPGNSMWTRLWSFLRKPTVIIGIFVFTLLITMSLWIFTNNRQQLGQQTGASGNYATQQVPLEGLTVNAPNLLLGNNAVAINGALQVNQGLIVTPGARPTNARAGQLYYDQTSNVLAYYNGTEFVPLTVNDQTSLVESIGGLSGQVALGGGLTVVGNQLVNTGVLSVASGSSGLSVSDDGNGNLTLNLSGGNTVTVDGSGGTSGRIVKFTGTQTVADSLLSESGTNITVNGDLTVTGSVAFGTPLSVGNGGTGAATLNNNGVLLGNGTGAISSLTAGGAGLCLVSTAGAPIWSSCSGGSSVASVNGAAGAVTIQGTAGQVSVTSGSSPITVSLVDTTVATGSYGSGSQVATFTVDAQGRLTAAGSTSIAINGNQITSGTVSVARGGTGAGTFTSNGVLYGNGTGALQVTSAGISGQVLIANGSGVPTFVSLTGDLAVSNAGATTIQADAVALGTDTTGNYVANVSSANGGIVVGGSAGEGWTPSLTLTLQGNKGLEVDSNGLSLIDCSTNQILKYNGSNQWACAADDLGTGDGGVTTVGTIDTPATSADGAHISGTTLYLQSATASVPGLVNTGAQTFAGAKTFNSTVAVQGASLTVGTGSSTTGSLVLQNATNNNTVTLQSGTTSSSYALTLPTAVGSANQCLKAQNGSGTLFWDNCDGGSGGVSGITTIGTIDTPTTSADGAHIASNTLYLQSATASVPGLVNTGTQTFAGAKTFNGQIVAGAGINLGAQTLQGTTAVIDFTNFDVASNGNITTAGDLAVNGGDITSTGALNITPGGTLTVGTYASGIATDVRCGDGTQCHFAYGSENDAYFGSTDGFSQSFLMGGASGIHIISSAGVDIGNGSTQGLLALHDGNGQKVTISVGSALAADTSIAIPAGVGASDTICLQTYANCAASGSAGGDLTGSYPNPTIAKLQGGTLTISSVTSGNILQYNGSAWVNQSISGDITLDGSGVATIANNAVTGAKINDNTITNSDLSSGSFTNITGVGTLTAGSLGSGFTTVAVGQGGTGATSFTQYGVVYGNNTGALQVTAAGTNGQCLVGNTGAAPSWTTCTGLVTLQNAYANGNTISTTGNDIAFTLNTSQSFTVATATTNTAGGITFTSGNTTGIQTNGLAVVRNGSGGTTTNGINITQTAGTLTNGLAFTGTIGTDIQRASGTLSLNGASGMTLGAGGSTKATVGVNDITLASNIDLLLQGATAYVSNPQGQTQSEAFGAGATVSNQNALAVGYGAVASGSRSIALGWQAAAANQDGIALGYQAAISGNGGVAIGTNTAAGYGGIALGYGAATTANNQLVIGSNGSEITQMIVGSGVTDATPDGFILQGTSGSGPNIAGASVTIAGGQGTGTGNGGNLLFQIANPAVGSSSTLNSLATVLTLSGTNGSALFKNTANSATAFQVQDTGSASLLTIDTAARSASGGNLIKVGNSTGTDTALTILQLDAASADPTTNLSALNGGLFYNSNTHKVSLIENGAVKIICNTTDLGCGTGAPRLDTIQAATGAGTIQNSNANTIQWNWGFTSAGTDAGLIISESSASTNGTQDQQTLLRLATLAGSTASPLQVTAGGTDVADVWIDLTGQADFIVRDSGVAAFTVQDNGLTVVGNTSTTTHQLAVQAATGIGGITVTGGTGNAATAAVGNSVVAGVGGAGSGASSGGAGGSNTITSGAGGSYSGTNISAGGGTGGVLVLSAGNGGATNNTSGVALSSAGAGGSVTITSGSGGNATGAGGINGGNGGALSITAGSGGTGTNNGIGGTVTISAGNSGGAFANGGNIMLRNGTGETAGGVIVDTQQDSTGAFVVLNASDVPLFTVDTTNSYVYIGNPSADSTGALLVLDTKNTSGDPNGVNGGMYYNSVLGVSRCYINSYWQDCLNDNPRTSYHAYSDFSGTYGTTTNTPEFMFDGDGVGGFDPIAGTAGHPGIVRGKASASGQYAIISSPFTVNPILLGNGNTWRYDTVVRIPTLSDGTNTFTVRAGFRDDSAFPNGDGDDACAFKYSHSVNSGKWQGYCADSGTSTCDTGITVAAGTWYRLSVVVNANATSVDFRVNGVSTCQVTSQIPSTTGNEVSYSQYINKTAGSTERNFDSDYIEVLGQFGTPR